MIGRHTQGVRVMNLKEGDRLLSAAVVPAGPAEDPEADATAG